MTLQELLKYYSQRSAERITEQHSSLRRYDRFGNLKFEQGWWGECDTSGIPEILLTEIEEAINQQICKRIPVKATNKPQKQPLI